MPKLSRLVGRAVPENGPVRILAIATLVNMVGSGIYSGISMIFFARGLGLSVRMLGTCLTVAVLIGMPSGIPFGHLGDRWGHRRVFIALQLLQGLFMAILPFVHGIIEFTMAVSGSLIAQQASDVERRRRTRAYLRSVTNVGMSLGIALSGFVLQADTRRLYVLLIMANALSFVMAGILLLRLLDDRQRTAGNRVRGAEALRDRPYLAVAGLSGLLSFQSDIIAIAALGGPAHHRAPLDDRLSDVPKRDGGGRLPGKGCPTGHRRDRGGQGWPSRRGRVSGQLLHFRFSCRSIPGAGHRLANGRCPRSLAGRSMVHGGCIRVEHGLAKENAHGQYEGVFNMASRLMRTASPVVLAELCLTWENWAG